MIVAADLYSQLLPGGGVSSQTDSSQDLLISYIVLTKTREFGTTEALLLATPPWVVCRLILYTFAPTLSRNRMLSRKLVTLLEV